MRNPPVSGRAAARRELAATLNRAARRLRNFESEEQWSRELVNSTDGFCRRAALFAINGRRLELRAARNLENGAPGPVPLAAAAAFASVVESQDTLVAMRTAGELSEALARWIGEAPGGRFFLFPLIVRERVAAILYADSEAQRPLPAAPDKSRNSPQNPSAASPFCACSLEAQRPLPAAPDKSRNSPQKPSAASPFCACSSEAQRPLPASPDKPRNSPQKPLAASPFCACSLEEGQVESNALELLANIGAAVLTGLPPGQGASQLRQIC